MPWTADDAERHTKKKPIALNANACGQKSPTRYWPIPQTKDVPFARPTQRLAETTPSRTIPDALSPDVFCGFLGF
jgi:hypothetical protein